jgi:hypothetical protein
VGGLALVRRDIPYGTSHFLFEKIAGLSDLTGRFIIWKHSRHQMKRSRFEISCVFVGDIGFQPSSTNILASPQQSKRSLCCLVVSLSRCATI